MNRRHFLEVAATSAAGLAATRAAPNANVAPPLQRIGLELYSVRKEMAKDFDRTLATVRQIGYTDVELLWSFDNFGKSPAEVKAALQREGLRAPSAHIAPITILVGWEKRLETAKLLGHEYLIVPSLTSDTSRTLDEWREWADKFNVAGAVARRAGIWLAFHNEPDHMKPIDGRVPYEVFVERTDPTVVRHQLDVGNMALGGADPMAYLKKYRDRYWSFHLKDVVADRSRDTELGTGAVDLPRIIAAVPDIGSKPCYVEQEGSADALASARRNFAYLRGLK
ncbi:MAG TPA: sugar phosphate isomerase/epimerase [Gemmatimonadaceae bacterium]|nr:sugar phosphate isomerase/epimerase [Gemmatimonadaceae bacterium]